MMPLLLFEENAPGPGKPNGARQSDGSQHSTALWGPKAWKVLHLLAIRCGGGEA